MPKFPHTHFSLGVLLQSLMSRIPAHLRLLGELRLNWAKWAGERSAAHSIPVFFDEKTRRLTVYCDSTEWNTALTHNTAELLQNIPKRMQVESLRFILKKNMPPLVRSGPASVEPFPPLGAEEAEELRNQIAAYGLDPETAQAAEEYLTLCMQMRRKNG